MKDSVFRHSPPPHLPALTQAAGPVAKVALSFFAAAAIGAGLGIYLRHRRDLAWTWSLLAVAPPAAILAALVEGVLPLARGSVVVLALALGLASGILTYSIYARLDDRRAGGDLEASAKRRRGLLDGTRRRIVRRVGSGRRDLHPGLPVGRDARGALACVPCGTPG